MGIAGKNKPYSRTMLNVDKGHKYCSSTSIRYIKQIRRVLFCSLRHLPFNLDILLQAL